MANLVNVKTFNTRLEAEVAKSFLKSKNIQAFVLGDDAGGAYPFPFKPSNTGVKLLADKKYSSKAKRFLKESGK